MRNFLISLFLVLSEMMRSQCTISANCQIFDHWFDQRAGVVAFNSATAYFISNTARDEKLLLVTKNHVIPSSVEEGTTIENVNIKFNFEAPCGNEEVEKFINANAIVKVLVRMSADDRALLEVVSIDTLPQKIVLLGWDSRTITSIFQQNPVAGVSFGHPTGLRKEGLIIQAIGQFPNGIIGKPNAGMASTGFSGSPLLDQNNRVRGDLREGTGVCQDQLLFFNGIKGYAWETFRSFLDPLGLGVDTCEQQIIGGMVPVELISFKAQKIGEKIVLSWSTATETNNLGFEIKRNGEKISFVSGKGTTLEKQEYEYFDNLGKEREGIFWYEIVQIDYNGTESSYPPVWVEIDNDATVLSIANYPNPFNSKTRINISPGNEEFLEVTVLNLLGQEIQKIYSGPSKELELSFNGDNLPSGIYLLKVNTITKKMVLIR